VHAWRGAVATFIGDLERPSERPDDGAKKRRRDCKGRYGVRGFHEQR